MRVTSENNNNSDDYKMIVIIKIDYNICDGDK